MSVYSPNFISFNILVNMLHPSALFTCYTCLCFVVKVVNKLRLWYEGTPKYLGESVTGMEKTKRFWCIYSNQGFWHWHQWMYIQTMVFPVCMHSGFLAGRSKQMIVTSRNDVTMISCAILGGNYKRRAHPNLGAVIWVFWHWIVGSTDKSQTLYSGYLGASCGVKHNQNELCVSFIHMHVPRPFWGTFSQYDFSCLMLAR